MKWFAKLALPIALAIFPACKNSSDDGGAAAPPVEVEPGTPVSGLSILAQGGAGTADAGGKGGLVFVAKGGGDVKIRASGAIDTAFSLPEFIVPALGANPRIVTANTVIGREDSTITKTESYLNIDGSYYVRGGVDTAAPATGIQIASSVTLTLNPTISDLSEPHLTTVIVNVPNGIHVLANGTLKTGVWEPNPDIGPKARMDAGWSVDNAASLLIYAENFIVNAGGSVVLTGLADSADADTIGGVGGNLLVSASGTIVTQGTIDVSGGAGEIGGDAGMVVLYSDYYGVYNTGGITAAGGAGSNGNGGNGYPDEVMINSQISDYLNDLDFDIMIEGIPQRITEPNTPSILLLSNYYAGVLNSGPLTATGGNGTAGGGAGGSIILLSGFRLESEEMYLDARLVISSGALNASGGNAQTAGSGGAAGSILMNAYSFNGLFRVAGSLTAVGGSGAGTNGYNGGPGGHVIVRGDPYGFAYIMAMAEGDLDIVTEAPLGDSAVGAAINTSGGAGPSDGGGAGLVGIVGGWFPGTNLKVVGCNLINCSGGAGAFGGVAGGLIAMSNMISEETMGPSTLAPVDNVSPTADERKILVLNEAQIIARGGTGTAGDGGNGGFVNILSFNADFAEEEPVLYTGDATNSADIDIRGGDGSVAGGAGTAFDFEGPMSMGGAVIFAYCGSATNTGNIDASGGGGGTGNGGASGTIGLLTYLLGSVSSSGNLTASGGSSAQAIGGSPQYSDIMEEDEATIFAVTGVLGYSVSVTGNLTCNGGSGPLGAGAGGRIILYDAGGTLTCNAALTANGGGGAASGAIGGSIGIRGGAVTTSGSMTARGGDDTDAAITPSGGNGGYIDVASYPPAKSAIGNTFDVAGGSPNGRSGDVWVDGVHKIGDATPPPTP
jgi:hypothetical protein